MKEIVTVSKDIEYNRLFLVIPREGVERLGDYERDNWSGGWVIPSDPERGS